MAYFDKYGVEFSDDRKTLVKCPKDFQGAYTISNGVMCINERAFYNCDLTSIVFPTGCEVEICNSTFEECLLHNVFIPGNVKKIGKRAFYNNNLESIYLSDGVEIIEEKAFAANESFKSFNMLELPASIKKIGAYAFDRKMRHEEDYYAEAGTIVFTTPAHESDQNELRTLILNCNIDCSWSYLGKHLENAIIHGGDTIAPYAFWGCKELQNIIFSNTITAVREHAFSGCDSLSFLHFPNDIELWLTSLPPNIQKVVVQGGHLTLKTTVWGEKLYRDLIDRNAFVDSEGHPITPKVKIFKIDKASKDGDYLMQGVLYKIVEVNNFESPIMPDEELYYSECIASSNSQHHKYNDFDDDTINSAFEGDPEATWNVD